MNVTAIILAGGKSRRFGRDKTALTFQGTPIIARTVAQCQGLCDEVLVVSNATGKFNLPGTTEIQDIYPDKGPLGGIHAGLSHARYDTAFVAACDMPYFYAGLPLMARILALAPAYDIVTPQKGGYPEPLFAAYRKGILPVIEDSIQCGALRLQGLFHKVRTYYLDEADWPPLDNPAIFYNINRPEDYDGLLDQEG